MSLPSPDPNATPPIPVEQAQFLSNMGANMTLRFRYILAQVAIYGAYTVLVFLALYTIANRPRKTIRTYWLLFALLVTFSAVTIVWTLDVAAFHELIRTTLINNNQSPVAAYKEYLRWLRAVKLQYIKIWVGMSGDVGLLFVVNDLLAAWRAMSIFNFSSRRVLGAVLYTLVFTSFAFWIAYAGLQTRVFDGFIVSSNADVSAILGITGSVASIAANLLATGMIGYAARAHRSLEMDSGAQFGGARILMMLTESGLLYLIIQIVRFALTLAVVPSTPVYGSLVSASMTFQSGTQVVAAMYPPALILIINYGFSIADTMHKFDLSTLDASSSAPSDPSAERVRRSGKKTLSEIRFRQQTKSSGTDLGSVEEEALGA